MSQDDTLPRLLVDAFDGEEELLAWTMGLSPSTRQAIAQWVLEPVGDGSRRRRAEQLAERLMSTMEAERELPRFIVHALNRAAGAMQGWRSMTALQRRMHLLAVFRPKGMEGRERQLERLVEASVLKYRGRHV